MNFRQRSSTAFNTFCFDVLKFVQKHPFMTLATTSALAYFAKESASPDHQAFASTAEACQALDAAEAKLAAIKTVGAVAAGEPTLHNDYALLQPLADQQKNAVLEMAEASLACHGDPTQER